MTKFYYPKAIPEGTQDLSRGNPVLDQVDPMPSHLPLVFVLAEKGQEEPLLADYARMVNEFGEATFNESGPYFTHQTRLLNIMASNGNAVMIQRVKPLNAATARVRLSVESRVIQSASGPKTQLIWHTEISRYPSNMQGIGKASEITFTRPVNTSDPSVLSQSTLTPVMDFDVRTFGKHGNMSGFSLEPVLEGMGSEEQHINMNAFLYRMRFFTRNNLNVPASPRPSDLGNYYFEGTFSLDSIFPRLSRSAYLGEVIKFEWDQTEGGYQNCPFAEPHIYADEIRALCERIAEGYTVPHKSGVSTVSVVGENTFDAQLPLTIDSRFALGTGVDKALLLNIFTGVMFDGNTPYHTFVVEKTGALTGEIIGANTIVYASGGHDGLAVLPDGKPNRLENMRILDDYVQTYMNEFGSGQYKLLDMAKYPVSAVWDTGFSYNTKIAMLTATQRRKDILAFLTGFIYADYEMVDDGETPGGGQLISCEGATPSVTIQTSFSWNTGGGNFDFNSDIEVIVNGVSRGTWVRSGQFDVTLDGSVSLPEFDLTEYPGTGLQTTITNITSEPVRLELRAIDAPARHGGFMDPGEDQNLSAVIEFQEDDEGFSQPEVEYPWDILKVCLAPSTNVACAPTDIYYAGFNEPVNAPNGSYPRLYFKVQVQIDNSPATESIVVTEFPTNRPGMNRGILFVDFLVQLLPNILPRIEGDITFHDANNIPFSFFARYGDFGLTQDQNGVTVYGYPGSPDGIQDRSTTLTFLTPSQAELDDFSNSYEVTAVDGAQFIFGTHPTWHSCSYTTE